MHVMITDIVRPHTVAEAVRAKSAPDAAWLGGGTWLNSGKAPAVRTLISLERLGLASIGVASGRCSVGAMATFQDIADAVGVPPALRDAVKLTASRTLRNMVTLGGELGLGPKDSAVIPVLLALDAEVSVAGRRKPLPIRSFLDEGKAVLILGVVVPTTVPAAMRAVSRTSHGPRSLVVAVGGPRVVASDCQGQLALVEDLKAFAPRPDMHAPAAYKRYMLGVLVEELRSELSGEASR
ncbi:MAG TPA: FAD binding domain-containing protein [Spirochaetia bacterium]|nr:FAD binding domain-containing protein [Spirochaetia bacterium]